MLRAASAYESVTTGQARHPLPETPSTAETNHSRVISVPGALTHIPCFSGNVGFRAWTATTTATATGASHSWTVVDGYARATRGYSEI